MREIPVTVDEEGNFRAWKAVVGGKSSHRLAKPVFPDHQPNYDFDKGVIIRIKSPYRVTGNVDLASEYGRRKTH